MYKIVKIIITVILFSQLCISFSYADSDKKDSTVKETNITQDKNEESGQYYLDKAFLCLNKKNILEALYYAERAFEVEPKNPNILFTKGTLDFGAGDFNSANKFYSLAIKYSENPNYEYYKMRSISYLFLGDYKKSLHDLFKIEKIYDEKMPQVDNSSLYLTMGIIEAKIAGEDIELPLIKSTNNNGLFYASYSNDLNFNNLSYMGYKIISKYIDKGIRKHPNNPSLYTMKAICIIKAGMKGETALENLNKAIEVNPFFYPAYMEMGDIYLNALYYEEALKNYSIVFGMMPENYYLLWRIGECYLGLGNYNKARMYFNMSLNNSSNIVFTQDDINMYMDAIKKMVDVQTKEIDFRSIIASLNAIIRKFNNKRM